VDVAHNPLDPTRGVSCVLGFGSQTWHPMKDDQELAALMASLRPMTEEEAFAQKLDFVYGNLACTTNHKPSRAVFAKIAREHGWTHEQFEKWAEKRKWGLDA
jgi:hypothetical protein